MFQIEIEPELRLELVHAGLAPHLAELVSAERDVLSQWLAWPPHCRTEADFIQFIHRSLHDYADGKSMVCAIKFRGVAVGCISFNRIDHQRKVATIGYWLGQKAQGHGIITRCCRSLIDIAFTRLELEKVEIHVATQNQSSRAVCQRLGMRLEGEISRAEALNGRVVDHAIYGLLRTAV
ncbi:GNAT family protein [Ferrimonas pelagia]|uniref:GNAT family protein n=1 Tax=Ferrimonas pelagia TaxID=1177826 RepID=A0ABP9EK32_9GAMM